MGDYNHRIGIRYCILSRPKEPSDGGLNSQHLEVVSGDEFYTNSVSSVTLVKVDSRRNGNAEYSDRNGGAA